MNDDKRRKILVITSLFPRPGNPLNGIFNYQSVSALAKLGDVRVLSPVSWIDRIRDRFRRSGREESMMVFHSQGAGTIKAGPLYPGYLTIPVVGRRFNGYMEYLCLQAALRNLEGRLPFDIILCYWVYPDGYASYLLSKKLGIPYVVVALGSDLNMMSSSIYLRGRVQKALTHAASVITVSAALRDQAVALGISAGKCRVIPNGVNRDIFKIRAREECRRKLGFAAGEGLLLYIGTMDPVKGLDVLLEALSIIDKESRPKAILIGSGEHRNRFERMAVKLGLAETVDFIASVPHRELPVYFNAADLLCLPSRNEGCPNVILEALACGTPVVAAKVGGIPELVTNESYGTLTPPEDPRALARAIENFFSRKWDREAISRANTRSWDDVAKETYEVIDASLSK